MTRSSRVPKFWVSWPLARNIELIAQLTRRDVVGRYRGSILGVLWSLLTPLLMLAVYTFVFGTVLRSGWPEAGQGASTPEFAIIVFAGLLVFQLFAEVVNRAPGLVLANPNYVRKVVFPLEVLVPAAFGSALFHTAVSVMVLLGFMIFVHHTVPLTALWWPAVLAPFCLLTAGLSWILASLGVYYRDISQLVGTALTAIMFLSPIFFPVSALPHWLRPWIVLNPVAWPVEATRNVLIFGKRPDLQFLLVYTVVALIVAVLGYLWFQKTKKGFADVL